MTAQEFVRVTLAAVARAGVDAGDVPAVTADWIAQGRGRACRELADHARALLDDPHQKGAWGLTRAQLVAGAGAGMMVHESAALAAAFLRDSRIPEAIAQAEDATRRVMLARVDVAHALSDLRAALRAVPGYASTVTLSAGTARALCHTLARALRDADEAHAPTLPPPAPEAL